MMALRELMDATVAHLTRVTDEEPAPAHTTAPQPTNPDELLLGLLSEEQRVSLRCRGFFDEQFSDRDGQPLYWWRFSERVFMSGCLGMTYKVTDPSYRTNVELQQRTVEQWNSTNVIALLLAARANCRAVAQAIGCPGVSVQL